MSQFHLIDHPLITHKLTIMRNKKTGSKDFRELLNEISMLMGYELTRDLPLQDVTITTSMISNYVKKKLVANPVKKQYGREQIAYLLFIAVAKTVMSMENIGQILLLQQRTYSPERAYEYFRREFENVLQYVFGRKETLATIGEEESDEKLLLRNVIISVAHKIYLDTCFAELRKAEAAEETE